MTFDLRLSTRGERRRGVLHLDADAFFASVEQASDPRLRGKAMAVGGEKRGIIASASYEARKFGVYTPMPTVRARRLCPQLIVVPGDYEKYEQFSRWMFSYAYDFTPDVEITSIDEGYFDLSGSRKPARDVAETLRRAIHQSLKITVSEGLGTNKLVSQIASKLRKPASLIEVDPGRELDFLHPLANRWLPGIGPKTALRFNAAGLARIGQIARTPVDHLALLVGAYAPTLREYANAVDERPVVAARAAAKTYGHQETFPEDQVDEAFIEATLRRMADSLMRKVRRDGKRVRTLTVRVRYNDMEEDRRSESLREPTDLEEEVYARLRVLLRQAWKRRVSLRLVSLTFSNLYDGWLQPELPLLDESILHDARRRLARTVDRLREQRGKYVVMRGHDLLLRQGRSTTSHLAGSSQDLETPRAATRNRKGPPPVPLHVHSYYSFLDSTLSPQDIVALAAHHELPAIALTDTANLHGAVPFHRAAKAAGIQPIPGAELRVDGKPLLLYVENQAGYKNLCRILSRASPACDLGPATCDRHGDETEGLIAVASDPSLAEHFAPGSFYLGAATGGIAARLAGRGHPVVAVPGIHYAKPADREKYRIVQSIRTLTLLGQDHPDKQRGAFHFRSPAGLAERFDAFPEALDRTREIAERCRFEFDFDTLHFPAYTPPDGSPPSAFLREIVMAGFEARYARQTRPMSDIGCRMPGHCKEGTVRASEKSKDPISEARNTLDPSPLAHPTSPIRHPTSLAADRSAIRRQLQTELAIIREVGYEEYFLVVWDLLQECRRRGIAWITRGSAADSLVCYCLGISEVCPVRFDLYFRRFLNRERMHLKKLPDIDVDFAHDEKDRVLDLVFEKYGPEHAACVGGFSTFKARSALAEAAKVLGVSERQIRLITKAIPHSRVRDLREKVADSPVCRELPLNEEPYATALDMAGFLDGFPRYAKMHPCGVVLSQRPIREHLPCFVSQKGYATTHFDMDAVEDIGLIKIDILAQGGLAAIRDARAMIANRGNAATRDQLPAAADLAPWRDPRVWELIASGQARAVHHIESPAMINLAKMLNVRDIDTLIAQVSIIRPGAANENKKVHYAQCHQGMAEPEYPHPSVVDCLKGSYGHVIFEEQVLQVCEAFAGMSPGESDRLRRALVKQDMDQVTDFGRMFYQHARAFGRSRDECITIWKFLCGFMGYAFCKAHSTAYGVEAYEAAWLKCYYPAEFMAAVLSNGKGFYQAYVYILECHRLGIPLLPPDVNRPGPGYGVEYPPRTDPPRLDAQNARRSTPPGRGISVEGNTTDSGKKSLPPAVDGRPTEPALPQSKIPSREGCPRESGGGVGAAIRIPAAEVKGLSADTLDRLFAEHARRPFDTLQDFYRRVLPDRDEMEALLRVGAFDSFGTSRTGQFWEIQWLRQAFGHAREDSAQGWMLPPSHGSGATGPPSHGSGATGPGTAGAPGVPLTEPARLERLQAETELLGFAASGHPLELYPDIDWNSYCTVERLGGYLGKTVTCCGLVIEQRIAHQVTGEPMKFMTLCDWTGMIETELFAEGYRNYGLATVRYPVLEVTATVEAFDNLKGWTLRILRAGKPRRRRKSADHVEASPVPS